MSTVEKRFCWCQSIDDRVHKPVEKLRHSEGLLGKLVCGLVVKGLLSEPRLAFQVPEVSSSCQLNFVAPTGPAVQLARV